MGLVLFFIDGIGIGPPREENPLSRFGGALLGLSAARVRDGEITGLPGPWRGRAIDATLGVAGLPQSATGQTTILTGVNAAAALGHHQSAFPGKTLQGILTRRSLLRQAREAGHRVTFANAFRPAFFESVRAHGRPRRASASTLATWVSGTRIRTLEDLRRGEALYHDVTREWLAGRGYDVPAVTAAEAGAHLAALAGHHDLVFFEHFLTDLLGHGRVEGDAAELLGRLEATLESLASALDPDRDGILVVSDHGNLEDLRVTSHTRHDVPLLGWGRLAGVVDRQTHDLTVVTPAILDGLG